jgi:ubiquitin carboxyl-terminal hydrolase 48
MTCLIDSAQSVVSADSYRDQRTLMRDLANDVITKKCSDGTYFVSKTWYAWNLFVLFTFSI